MEVELELKKTVDQNATIYYEKAKKAKKKLKGALATVETFEKKLINAKKEHANKLEKIDAEHNKVKRKLYWFEKFRWFITSTGFLVIGGRDATTNEVIIKKHTENEDLVFHTDMAGSPFFVIKKKSNPNKEIDQQTLLEVGDATCSFSRAWKNGIGTSSVFYVKPNQVTKEANTGEYLTKGAFMIRGKTNYIDNNANLAIGLIKKNTTIMDIDFSGMIMCAPKNSIIHNCEEIFVEIKEGGTKASDIAKTVRKEFSNASPSIDDVVRILPSGGSDIVKRRKRKYELNK